MKLPYYRPDHRSVSFSLMLMLALTLLVLTGLGVFRLYFGFDWTAGENESGQLFSVNIRGGQSFNLFEADSFGQTFWTALLIMLLQCLLTPLFRLPGATILTIAATVALGLQHARFPDDVSPIPVEFELLTVFLLFGLYILLSYIGEVRDRKRVHRLLSQYVPAELAREYEKDPQAVGLTGRQQNISVLFCDVIGFMAISEQLEPTELTEWLNLYFTYVSRVVVRYRGSIDKYMGDSVMAVWGAPTHSETHAYDAVCAAMDMHSELQSLNDKYRDRQLPPISMGIGISSGPAMVGPLGSEYRMDYTVVGDCVNVAQRLEAQTRKYQVPVIVSDKTASELPGMLFRELDTVMVKGRRQAVTMFQPLGSQDQLSEQVMSFLSLHEEAMAASKSGDWDKAVMNFSRLHNEWGPQSMYELYLRGVEQARRA